MLVVHTQHYENYGAHDWDGKGACPQYWKAKGGDCIKVTNAPANIDPDQFYQLAQAKLAYRNDGFEVVVLEVTKEADDWMSWFEKSQLEYEGSIQYAEPSYTYEQLLEGVEA